jgi:hypothetical protein
MTLSDIEKMISSTPNDYDLGGMIRNNFSNLKLYEERPWGYTRYPHIQS